jgi:hypothetical protein
MRLLSGYQLGARWQGTRMNIALLSAYFDPEARTSLDVGSNEGAITCAMALSGTTARGVELSSKYVGRARALASRLGCPASFEERAMSLEDIEAHPSADVITFLSVHHQIAAAQGLSVADDYVRALSRKSARQFFFQPACISEKYGDNAPKIADNDLPNIIKYFAAVVGAELPYLSVIGFAQNDLPKHEPVRPMMLFSRAPVFLRQPCHTSAILSRIEAGVAAASPISSAAYAFNRLFNRGSSTKGRSN